VFSLVSSLSSLLLLSNAFGGGPAWRWPVPATPGAALQDLDRRAAAPTSELDITITVRSRTDVTVICRTRGELFNHDLPAGGPTAGQCAQVTGEAGSERIEDGRTRPAVVVPARRPAPPPRQEGGKS
jgi:hypothetical protein